MDDNDDVENPVETPDTPRNIKSICNDLVSTTLCFTVASFLLLEVNPSDVNNLQNILDSNVLFVYLESVLLNNFTS